MLDAKTFEGLTKVSVTAEPSETQTSEPAGIMEYEFRADKVDLTACGAHQELPYVR